MRNDFSAGGVTTDSQGRVALIRTKNLRGQLVWGVPKFHPEPGEKPRDAARREVEEETGLTVEVIGSKPCSTVEYWFVDRSGERVHKRVDFYRMRQIGGDPANHDNEVEEVALITPAEALERLTYANERAALADALDV